LSISPAPTDQVPANVASEAPPVEGKKFAIRAAAYIIDTIVAFVANWLVALITGAFFGLFLVLVRAAPFPEAVPFGLSLLFGLIQWLIYFVLFEWLFGASPGKAILGMRVVMQTGEKCTFGAVLARGLLRYVDGLFFGLPALGRMKPPLYQRIGDHAAKTIVAAADDPVIREPRSWALFFAAGVTYLAYSGLWTLLMLILTMTIR
jgi:uncharacterized RDD family membrane protein YckC